MGKTIGAYILFGNVLPGYINVTHLYKSTFTLQSLEDT